MKAGDDIADVSVVLPMYNRAGYVERAVRSVLTQELGVREVIVVDDGSTDQSVAIVDKIADPRVRVIRTSGRCGAPTARNIGTEAALSDWIAFQDSDDFWFPQKLKLQFEALRETENASVSFCFLLQIYDNFVKVVKPKVRIPQGANLLPHLIGENFISTQTLVVRREALLSVGGFDPELPRFQDWDLVLRLVRAGYGFSHVPEPLAVAYETPGNLTSFTMKGVDARERILEKHADLGPSYPSQFSQHHFIMSSLCRKGGQLSRAAVHARLASRWRPFYAKAILMRSLLASQRYLSARSNAT